MNEKNPLEVTREDLIGVSEERKLEELESSDGEKVEDVELKTEDGEAYEYSDADNNPDPIAKSKEEDIPSEESLLEDNEEEGEFDYSDIEFDERGVPVLNSKDLENICYYSSFVGMDKKQMLEHIKTLYADLDQYFRYKELPEEERDESLKEMYSDESFEATKKTLATFQREARSKTLKELEEMNVTQVIENANVTQLWLTSLYLNHISKENDTIFPKDLSLEEILRKNNYYSIFLKEVDNLIDVKKQNNQNIIKRLFDLDFYSSIIGKFSAYFKTIFFHVGFSRVMYKVGAHTNKIQDSINSIIPEYYHRFTRYAFIHDEKFKERYKKLVDTDSETPLTEKELDEKVLQVKEILEKDQLYYELMNYTDDDNIIEKSCNLINRIHDISEKFTTNFKNKDKFLELLQRVCGYLTEYVNSVYKKYKVNNLEELGKFIVTECNKYEEPPAKTMEKLEKDVDKQLGDNDNRDEKLKVENAMDEINKFADEQNNEENKSQGERDKFTPFNYPFLESVKYALGLLKDLVEYIQSPTNLKKANVVVIQFVFNFFNHIVYSVLDSYGLERRGKKDFFLRFIDLTKPINELNNEEIVKKNKEEPSQGFTSSYQDELIGVMMEELSTAITITEVCHNNEDMMADIFDYYNTKEHENEKDTIRIISLTYQKNNVIDIRHENTKTLLSIYNKTLDLIEELISDDNKIDIFYKEIEQLIQSQNMYNERRKNKKNKKRK